MNGMLSVKEFNKVLEELTDNNLNKKFFGNNVTGVDIVFVAGLMLWYEKFEDSFKRLEITYLLNDNKKSFEISQYFEQY
ncbi:MAG: hypothetical protein LBI42_13485 [Chitinispirillales bacterium]|jgi:hypothetical protein|nr:hypothetical protein [Chitinispirillales bacterium]